MPSDVQVFVRFQEQSVFAGEELDCVITFKNVAEVTEPPPPTPAGGVGSARHSRRDSITRLAAQNARLNTDRRQSQSVLSPSLERPRGRHQDSPSASVPSTPSVVQQSPAGDGSQAGKPVHRHQRSVSIISGPSASSSPLMPPPSPRLNKNAGHRRSSTVQYVPQQHTRTSRQPSLSADTTVTTSGPRRQLSAELFPQYHRGHRSPLSASHSPASLNRQPSPEFRFPAEPTTRTSGQIKRHGPSAYPGLHRTSSTHNRNISVASRASSAARDSVDIYSQGNRSDETLQSDHPTIMSENIKSRQMPSNLIRQHYKMDHPTTRKPQAATLLMGYASVNANFVLDASLVDQTPFESVKAQGFIGGQSGGGVVGVKKKQRPASGLFGGFNLASLGESLANIVGDNTSSSTKEMKAVTNSRAVPLLSTPQTLLFVDLHLEPGDERSYSFTYRLPQGLPSAYRGKAIKIVYNLTIGVQSAPDSGSKNNTQPEVRQIQIPFRVFSGVDDEGELLGHDLMQPHIVLRDAARTVTLDDAGFDGTTKQPTQGDMEVSSIRFLEFVDTLLDRHQRRMSSSSLTMVPIDKPSSGHAGSKSRQTDTIRAISNAIARANQIQSMSKADSTTSPNKFSISTAGFPIATLIIDRPLHRLGETVTLFIDLAISSLNIAFVRCTLESHEKVDPALAVRSTATIARLTRRIYASKSETSLFAKRIVFCPAIPPGAVPTFITTGVSFEWFLKVEFGVIKQDAVARGEGDSYTEPEAEADRSDRRGDHEATKKSARLLEEVLRDERGVTLIAVESLDTDSFEVTIPITVYGDIFEDGSAHDENEVIVKSL